MKKGKQKRAGIKGEDLKGKGNRGWVVWGKKRNDHISTKG